MKRYLAAEWGRTAARPQFRIALAILTALAALLALAFCWTGREGVFRGSFGDCMALLVPFFTAGLYLAVVAADTVFSEQYKHHTLKNEVACGIPRVRIYLGKLVTAAGAGLLAAFLALLTYTALCRLLIPMEAGDWPAVQTFLFRLLGALPLWLGALALTMAAMFTFAHTLPMLAVVFGCLMALGPTLRGMARLGAGPLAAGADLLWRLTLSAPMDAGAAALWDPAWLGWCWGVGLLWAAGSTLTGLLLFARRDIS